MSSKPSSQKNSLKKFKSKEGQQDKVAKEATRCSSVKMNSKMCRWTFKMWMERIHKRSAK
jgi:hypothetical protein